MEQINTKKILVVEDEPELRSLYTSILKEQGFTVDECTNGENAANMIKTGNYNLVLLDIMMPKKNGLQVLDELFADPQSKDKNFNIVILTNLGQDSIIAQGVKYNIRGYMIKSDYNPAEFLKEIKNYLA